MKQVNRYVRFVLNKNNNKIVYITKKKEDAFRVMNTNPVELTVNSANYINWPNVLTLKVGDVFPDRFYEAFGPGLIAIKNGKEW